MQINQNIKLAVDAVVFGYENSTLYVLLIRQKYGPLKDQWALPGGFVRDEESLSNAVRRELKEETNITVDYLEQLFTFGDEVDRDPRARVVSVSYFGIVNPKGLQLAASTDAEEAKWFELPNLPNLAFDHAEIIKKAKARLQAKLNYQPIGFNLLNREFPFSDLENLYMTILGKSIDRRNFRKKILSFGIVEETEFIRKEGSGRPARLYRFNQAKYQALEQEGIHFEIKFA